MKRTRNLILSGISAFALGWGLVFFCGHGNETQGNSGELKKVSASRFGEALINEKSSLAYLPSRVGFAEYFQHVQNLRTVEECEVYFENIIEDAALSLTEKHFRMSVLLFKWGELAPRQAIQKVQEGDIWKISKEYDMTPPWLTYVFTGWAGKDPEAAAAFFKETSDPRIQKDPMLPVFLVQKWAEHSAKDAWRWLESLDKDSIACYEQCKLFVLYSMQENNVERIPEFIAGLDERDSELYAPQLWWSWFKEHPESTEVMASLSGENKEAALMGSISGKTRGDLDAFTQEIAKYSPEEQKKIIFELAPGLLYGDKEGWEDRIHWVMKNAPEVFLQNSVKNSESLRVWLHENREEGKAILDRLPSGKEKEALMEVFNSPPLEYR